MSVCVCVCIEIMNTCVFAYYYAWHPCVYGVGLSQGSLFPRPATVTDSRCGRFTMPAVSFKEPVNPAFQLEFEI